MKFWNWTQGCTVLLFSIIKKSGLDWDFVKLSARFKFVIFIQNNKKDYKYGHSTESALLRVYNDIVCTVDKGNGYLLVILDLSAALATIDHANLFNILWKHICICGSGTCGIINHGHQYIFDGNGQCEWWHDPPFITADFLTREKTTLA